MIEQTQTQTASQKWHGITKVQLQPLTLESAVVIPAAWASMLSVPLGAAAGIVAAVASGKLITGAAIGTVVTLGAFWWEAGAAIAAARAVEVQREEYDGGSESAARAARAVVRLEVTEQRSTGYNRTIYDELQTDIETLRAICAAERLSVRGLGEVGIASDAAMPLLAALVARGYVAREADNKPGEWTARGKALCKALTG